LGVCSPRVENARKTRFKVDRKEPMPHWRKTHWTAKECLCQEKVGTVIKECAVLERRRRARTNLTKDPGVGEKAGASTSGF